MQAAGPGQVNPATIETGGPLFRERCADCHGGDAKGPRGPDLTGLWIDAAADERAFQTIRTGIPGSIMPSSSAPDDELWAIVSYLRSISTAGAGERSAGNATAASGFRGAAAQLSSRQRPRRPPRPRSVADCATSPRQRWRARFARRARRSPPATSRSCW